MLLNAARYERNFNLAPWVDQFPSGTEMELQTHTKIRRTNHGISFLWSFKI